MYYAARAFPDCVPFVPSPIRTKTALMMVFIVPYVHHVCTALMVFRGLRRNGQRCACVPSSSSERTRARFVTFPSMCRCHPHVVFVVASFCASIRSTRRPKPVRPLFDHVPAHYNANTATRMPLQQCAQAPREGQNAYAFGLLLPLLLLQYAVTNAGGDASAYASARVDPFGRSRL